MNQDNFQKQLLKHSEDFRNILETPNGDWSVKGFIDIAKNIYTISVDTKVISKIIELMMFPVLKKFANENNYEMIFSA
ncbi:MAG: type II restriction endonuclease, partial [Patescibacteria group bacterium]